MTFTEQTAASAIIEGALDDMRPLPDSVRAHFAELRLQKAGLLAWPAAEHTCLAGPLCSYWYGASYPAPYLDQDGYALDSGVCPHASCNQVMDAMSCLACWTEDATAVTGFLSTPFAR
jgi:hypothetical protein